MAVINQVLVEVLNVVERQVATPSTSNVPASTNSQPASSSTMSSSNNNQSGGPTSSPLLFFVALGFGVVFTNLWIIVGVKYCFRYNARNRAIRNGEEVDPITLENMPTRPHRRRREKKLMTMDEVNERFPLTKYKNWMASRAREGLSTSGGVDTTPSRAGSLRDADGIIPSSPTGTKHSIDTRPKSTVSDGEAADITVSHPTNHLGGQFGDERKGEKAVALADVEEVNRLEEVQTIQTTATHLDKQATAEEEEEDDHIHTAVPPELLTNPGDTCAICIDTLEEDDDIRGLTCGHAFHAGCLDPWLTSRRACCPLCKADYYVPKPRPEGEAADTDRTGRRRTDRTNMPAAPQSAWTGIRGNPRLMLLGRTGTPVQPDSAYNYSGRRRDRRRSQTIVTNEAAPADASAVQQSQQSAGTSRFGLTHVWNPFRNMSLPRRNNQASSEQPLAEPSPSQLESGVVR